MNAHTVAVRVVNSKTYGIFARKQTTNIPENFFKAVFISTFFPNTACSILFIYGLATCGNFYRQLGGNQLQCMLHDHFGSTWVNILTLSYDPQQKNVNIQIGMPSLLGDCLVAPKLPRVTWRLRQINAFHNCKSTLGVNPINATCLFLFYCNVPFSWYSFGTTPKGSWRRTEIRSVLTWQRACYIVSMDS